MLPMPDPPPTIYCEINDLAAHHLQCAREYAAAAPDVCLFIDMAMLELRRMIPDAEQGPTLKPIRRDFSIPLPERPILRFPPLN